ncbi:MAG: lipoprotein signal peptidase [Flavobacteriales bacterium]|nr:lipoprotein signal peptidase [Flavobacteriales bacterium]
MKRALTIILLVLLADQVLKVWVKLTFFYDTAIPLAGDWSFLHFIENRGMAFGMEFGGQAGKLALTLLRIAAVTGIGYALVRMVKHGASRTAVASVALVFAGALGNIIDSTFYGLLFSTSTPLAKAVLFPPDGGYAPLFHGAVVDMFYFPLWEGRLPDWIPAWGGEYFVFFRPVFNLADAAISIGIGLFILSQRKDRKGFALSGRVPEAGTEPNLEMTTPVPEPEPTPAGPPRS